MSLKILKEEEQVVSSGEVILNNGLLRLFILGLIFKVL